MLSTLISFCENKKNIKKRKEYLKKEKNVVFVFEKMTWINIDFLSISQTKTRREKKTEKGVVCKFLGYPYKHYFFGFIISLNPNWGQ